MNLHQEAEQIHAFLNWWELASCGQRSELCCKLACRAMSDPLILVSIRRQLINHGLTLLRSKLSSGQERKLLEIIKDLIRNWQDFSWPKRDKLTLRPFINRLIYNNKEAGFKLFKWQKQALHSWINADRKGIIKAVTGSGKTIVALDAIRTCLLEGGRIAVVVPTTALLKQWQQQLLEKLELKEEQIGLTGNGYRCQPAKQLITIWVINSARNHLPQALENIPIKRSILLIVDECHRAGSKENAKLFTSRYDYVMGLSATPERQGDPGYEKILVPALGKQIFNYDFSRALKEGIIPPFDLVNIGVEFSPWERGEYERQTEDIRLKLKMLMLQNQYIRWHICKNYYSKGCFKEFAHLRRLCQNCSYFVRWENPDDSPQFFKFLHYLSEYEDDKLASYIIHLLIIRKRFVADAKARIPMALEVLKKCSGEIQTLVFIERISHANEIGRKLKENLPNFEFGIYHSQISSTIRQRILKEFREGSLQALISCHALDEGLDVPSANIGVIVSSSSSIRQRIQRLGRILRTHPGKERSTVFNFYVYNTSERQLMFREFQEEGMDRFIGCYNPPAGEEITFLNKYLNLKCNEEKQN